MLLRGTPRTDKFERGLRSQISGPYLSSSADGYVHPTASSHLHSSHMINNIVNIPITSEAYRNRSHQQRCPLYGRLPADLNGFSDGARFSAVIVCSASKTCRI